MGTPNLTPAGNKSLTFFILPPLLSLYTKNQYIEIAFFFGLKFPNLCILPANLLERIIAGETIMIVCIVEASYSSK
jgi:hypothetical protein